MPYRSLFIFFLLTSTYQSTHAQQFHRLMSSDGAEIEAELIEGKSDDFITIRRKNGKTYKNIPLARFSPETEDLIKNWQTKQKIARDDAELTKDSRIKIYFSRKKNDKKNNYNDIDDRIVSLEPGVILESEELLKTYNDITGTIVVIGTCVIEKKNHVILSKENFKIPSLSPKEKKEWEGTNITCRYDPDYGGYEYRGYLIVLRNKKNKIVLQKDSFSKWTDNPQNVLQAKKFKGYNRNFDTKLSLITNWGLPK